MPLAFLDNENSPVQQDRVRKSSKGGESEFVGLTVHRRYKLDRPIGRGTFGEVYSCVDMITGHTYAAKVDTCPSDRKASVVGTELGVFNALRNKCKVTPYLVASGSTSKLNYIVMQRLGPSLSILRSETPANRFTLATALRLGIQMVGCISRLHKVGYVHCDVKPSNFVIGRRRRNVIRILDFGVARRYLTSHGKPVPPRETAGFRGTARYASPNTHCRCELSPRDDYWGVLFSMAEMVMGRLPWDNMKNRQEVWEMKSRWIDGLCPMDSLPECFGLMAAHLVGLTYYDPIDPVHVVSLLTHELQIRGLPQDGPFDWEIPVDNASEYYTPGDSPSPAYGSRASHSTASPRSSRAGFGSLTRLHSWASRSLTFLSDVML